MPDVTALYRHRAAGAEAARERCAARSRLISYARLASFLSGLALLVAAAYAARPLAPVLYGTSAALFGGFVVLLRLHDRVETRRRWHEAQRLVNEQAAGRLARRWADLPDPGVAAPPPDHPYADDLDLFGAGSLFQLLGGGSTGPGRAELAGWLLAPAAPPLVRERQAAVAELAPQLDLRQDLAAHGHLMAAAGGGDVEPFLRWAGEPRLFIGRRLLVWSVRLLTAAIWLLLGLHVTGVVGYPAWLVPVVPGLLLTAVFSARVGRTFDRALAQEGAYHRFAELFARVAGAPFEAPLLRRVQRDLATAHHPAHWHMRRLHRIGELADFRFAAPILHLPVQALTLWDFHVLFMLEAWQQRAGRHARRWLAALGRFDALSALAGLRHDNPEWAFPEIDEAAADGSRDTLEARALAHPMIPDTVRVPNDVTVGPPGTVLLVTGSNMSGKSTLLRAIGVNVVLAQAGGPVCASALRMPPLLVCTSMRVHDSLQEGVSYFMAGLRRLKQIVDAAREADARGGTLLYLLDEILQGTNSAERQIAVRTILTHLLARRAIGAVTTHDLELARADELAAAARPVHFRETVLAGERGGTAMTFDYELRPGIATSRNALLLMRAIGLPAAGEPPSR